MQENNSTTEVKCSPFRRVCIVGLLASFIVLVAAAHFTTVGIEYVLPAFRGLFFFIGAILLPFMLIVAYAAGCCGMREIRDRMHARANTNKPHGVA